MLKKLMLSNLSLLKQESDAPIYNLLLFLAINVCTFKKLSPHLQSKQTDKFFIVKV